MNVVDSSAWVEYFVDGPNAGRFAPAIEDAGALIVPAIALYEVFKWGLRERGEQAALRLAGVMYQGWVVDMGPDLALAAVRIAVEFNLAMADSVIFATARAHGATLWTQDADFARVPGVRYVPKGKTGKGPVKGS
jgi:predicted nucleic acid-binding protein